jgi:hypothetical protein
MRHTGRLDTPSIPVSSSTLPAPPPQPSWRIRAIRTRSGRVPAALASVRLIHQGRLAAAVALDAQEPRREGPERLVQGLGGRRQRFGAGGPPLARRDRPSGHSHAAQIISPASANSARTMPASARVTFPRSRTSGASASLRRCASHRASGVSTNITAGSSLRSGAWASRPHTALCGPRAVDRAPPLTGEVPKFRAADGAAHEHRRLAVGPSRLSDAGHSRDSMKARRWWASGQPQLASRLCAMTRSPARSGYTPAVHQTTRRARRPLRPLVRSSREPRAHREIFVRLPDGWCQLQRRRPQRGRPGG